MGTPGDIKLKVGKNERRYAGRSSRSINQSLPVALKRKRKQTTTITQQISLPHTR